MGPNIKIAAQLARLAGWLAVVVISILSLVPGILRPHIGAPPKLEHVAAYLITAGLLSLGYRSPRQLAIIAVTLSLYSGLLEIGQIFVPGRSAAVSDFLASSAGAFIGCGLAWIVLRLLKRDFA